jgi:glycosyltransferase involved in cell wall biosynthesis
MTQQLHQRLPQIDWKGGIWDSSKWLYYQGADLYCLPSFSENFGLSVLESLQVGTRVLTTTATPWYDLTEFSGGYLTTPDVASIAEALRRFFQNPKSTPDQRLQLSELIHKRYSWNALGGNYLNLYSHLAQDA